MFSTEKIDFRPDGLRPDGVFLGDRDHEGDPLPEFIGARPQDLQPLVQGIIAANERMREGELDSVLQAAATTFGFVYIHPFQDGNGRLHRCLIHHVLAERKFTPPGGFTTLSAGLPEVTEQPASDPSGVLLGMRAFDYHNSYIQQFNLGIEQQYGNNTIRVFYVGALGRHIARSFNDVNAPLPNTAVNPNLLRPYYSTSPNLTSVIYIDTEASSSYDALQTSFARSYRNGLTVQFNYTWTHGLDNAIRGDAGSGTIPALTSTMDYGNSSFDVRHRMAATLFYELPFGKGSSGAKGLLTKSWQLNLSGVWSTGLPFTVLNATDVSNTNPGASGADRPDQIGSAALSNPTVNRFFNTDAFVAQAAGTLGNERRNQLYGPHNRRLDASLFKNFTIVKEASLQFRAEVFNITNTANFAAPAALLGGANFGQLAQMTAGYTPREVQFAIRLQF